MKILVLSHISEILGGAERSMLDLITEWQKYTDIKPEFIVRKPVLSLGPELKKRGWKYYALDYNFWSHAKSPEKPDDKHYQRLHDTNAVLEIEEIIKNTKPDIVITNSVVCPWAALAAYYQQVPHVWFVREYGDLDHGRVYTMGREKTYHDVNLLSDIVATNSKTLATYLGNYIPKNKLVTIYNPFDLAEMRKKAKQTIDSPFLFTDSLKLVLTGNLAPSKGQLDIVKIIGSLKSESRPVELCLIGRANDEDYEKTIRQYIKEADIEDRVHLAGFKNNPLPYVRSADVGLMMSKQEAFGRVTFEYLVLGKPVIGRDSGANPEMIEPDKNGFLFSNEKDIKEAILKYLHSPDLVATHGEQSTIQAEQMLNSDDNADHALKKIKRLVGKTKKNDYLYISHEWLNSSQKAEDHIDDTHTMAFSRIILLRGKRKLKHIYKKIFS